MPFAEKWSTLVSTRRYLRVESPMKRRSRTAVDVAIVLPDLRGGGAERVNINLANEFVARGFSVDMLLMCATGEFMQLLDPKVRIVDLGADRVRRVFYPLANYLRKARPSSILACMWPLTVVALAARLASRVRTRVVVAEHTTWSASERRDDAFYRRILAATMRLGYPRADGVVAVSNGTAGDLANIARLPRDRITVIYNPIVGSASSGSNDRAPLPASWADGAHKKVLAVGTLKTIKDYPTLLRAFAILRRGVDARLLILGEGKERGALEQLIHELGITSDVVLPGFAADTRPYYRRADLHVLSSTGEGFGNVIVEALEAGTPVVGTDCPSGPREILDGGRYGTLVPVADPEALAGAMADALARQHDTAALQARSAEFNVDKAVDAYLDLLLPHWRKGSAA